MHKELTDPRAAEARKLRGSMTISEIARHFSVSRSTVNRWIYPGLAEKGRILSREAKRRRTGTCLDCGAVTKYNGHEHGVSPRCPTCAAIERGKDITIWTEERVISAIQDWNATYGEPPAIPDWNPYAARYELVDEARAKRWERDRGRWPWFTSVVYRFGSWNAAIRAAGFEPRVSGGGGGNTCRRRNVNCESEGAAPK